MHEFIAVKTYISICVRMFDLRMEVLAVEVK